MKDWNIPINQDLTSIKIELEVIRFEFAGGCVDFGDKFELSHGVNADDQSHWFDPSEKSGELNRLWPLINISAECVVLSQEFLSLNFANRMRIKCFNTSTFPEQVCVWGFESEEDRKKYPEDEFVTNYPNDYLNSFKKNIPEFDLNEIIAAEKE